MSTGLTVAFLAKPSAVVADVGRGASERMIGSAFDHHGYSGAPLPLPADGRSIALYTLMRRPCFTASSYGPSKSKRYGVVPYVNSRDGFLSPINP